MTAAIAAVASATSTAVVLKYTRCGNGVMKRSTSTTYSSVEKVKVLLASQTKSHLQKQGYHNVNYRDGSSQSIFESSSVFKYHSNGTISVILALYAFDAVYR